ncbi:MAG TPA: DUF4190 domain-containing protein [Acidimicrobiia bacterium]|nr:DUF4190 domain-containing protein [Acidimicrobiia bacterium]
MTRDVSADGQPVAFAPVPSYPPPVRVRTNGLAIAALVSGLLFITMIGAVLAVVFGHIALGQIKRSRGWQRGGGMAVAGLVLGYAGLAVIGIAILSTGTGAFE